MIVSIGQVAGQAKLKLFADFRVFVDGDHLRSVIRADEEEGWVAVIELDYNGKPMTDMGGNFHTRRINGKVRVYPRKKT